MFFSQGFVLEKLVQKTDRPDGLVCKKPIYRQKRGFLDQLFGEGIFYLAAKSKVERAKVFCWKIQGIRPYGRDFAWQFPKGRKRPMLRAFLAAAFWQNSKGFFSKIHSLFLSKKRCRKYDISLMCIIYFY